MSIRRRGFLFGLLAAPALPVAVKAAEAVPAEFASINGTYRDFMAEVKWNFATYGDHIFVTDSEGFHRYNGHEWLTEEWRDIPVTEES